MSPLFATAALDEVDKLMKAGHYRQALSRLDSMPTGEKADPHYLFSHARALAATGQYMQAIAQYEVLLKRQPNLPEPYNNLALIYIQQGKPEQARAMLNKALLTHPGYARVYKNLTAINTARARDAYAKALQMPTANQVSGLQIADSLSLPVSTAKSTAPVVTATAESHIKPNMVYQAKNAPADTKKGLIARKERTTSKADTVVQSLLHNWARAWSTKNVEQYLHFYSDDYAPSGISHGVWAAQRRQRINRPKWIRVQLRNLTLTELGNDRLSVRLEQEYAADNYRDITRKEFVLQRLAGEWRIIRERGLGHIVR